MNPHPAISLALIDSFESERTRVAPPRSARSPRSRLRAVRSRRRTARAAAAAC